MKSLLILFAALLITTQGYAQDEAPQRTWSYDLGASLGSTSDTNYQEINLGLNYHFNNWLIWRNALFARFSEAKNTNVTAENSYGLDTSLRFDWTRAISDTDVISLFGGPGLRVDKDGKSEGFAEAGARIRVGGLNLGGGVKSIFTSGGTDTQYFIILNGAGNL